jgi:hypothetical protein
MDAPWESETGGNLWADTGGPQPEEDGDLDALNEFDQAIAAAAGMRGGGDDDDEEASGEEDGDSSDYPSSDEDVRPPTQVS